MSTITVTVTYRTGRGEQDIEMIEHVTSLRIHFGALILRDTDGVERCWPPREWTGYVSEPDEEQQPVVSAESQSVDQVEIRATPATVARLASAQQRPAQRQEAGR